ncbi:MAG TPA: enoyl-CoA hydratase/isomerase family protein [Solirubrobacterales bacterium]|nr:enoyl-CoA hydratase/isomerase family protein [Solirubrobacterales bacterium]
MEPGTEVRSLELVRDGRVRIERREALALITMNRPEKRNALDRHQIEALEEAVEWLISADGIRAAVLTGDARAFSAGGDIEMFEGIGPDNALAFTRRGYDLLRPLETSERVVVAAVNGYCLAGGLEVALACDFIIAGEGARFGFGEVDLGLIPGWGGTVRLARGVSPRLARQWTLTSEQVSAARAAEVGIVNEVVADDEVLERALEVAERISRQPPRAVVAAKTVIHASLDSNIDAALAAEGAAAAALFGTTDVRSRVEAWVNGNGGGS